MNEGVRSRGDRQREQRGDQGGDQIQKGREGRGGERKGEEVEQFYAMNEEAGCGRK
jgi:hypothetical protein